MALSPIQAAKARHSLAEVAGRTGIYVPTGGRSVTVHCPMPAHGHYDRTPSMRLHLNDGIWCCFGCSPSKPGGGLRGGDVVDWVRQTERVDGWRDAVAILDSGRRLSNAWDSAEIRATSLREVRPTELPDPARSSAREVQAAVAAAWDYYTTPSRHDQGLKYLASRRINIVGLEAFNGRTEVGHTPSEPRGLVSHLQSCGFEADVLVDAGLAHRQQGRHGLVDFYRQRVLVPVRLPSGAVVGFIGRNVGDSRWPKYKNPPRTTIYNKSVTLYQPLPGPSRPGGLLVVVEGPMDALAVSCAALDQGVQNLVCPLTQSGKQLSPNQIQGIAKLERGSILISFDGDLAGREAAQRLRSTMRLHGADPIMLTLPADQDPASWLAQKGSGGIRAFLGSSCSNVPGPLAAGPASLPL